MDRCMCVMTVHTQALPAGIEVSVRGWVTLLSVVVAVLWLAVFIHHCKIDLNVGIIPRVCICVAATITLALT
jgi:hypothetical protein